MRKKLEVYLIVTLFTLLIWLLAEQNNVVREQIQISVWIKSPASQRLVIEPDTPRTVTVLVSCSTGQIAGLKERLKQQVREFELEYDGGASQHPVVYTRYLERDDVFEQFGATIESVEPPTLSLEVEPLVQVTMKVAIDSGGVEIAEPGTDPGQATVELPSSAAPQAKEESLIVRIDPTAPKYAGEGPHTEVVEIELPLQFSPHNVTITPRTAAVTFKVRELTSDLEVKSIPINTRIHMSAVGRFTIEPAENDRVLRSLKLTGPRQVMQNIREAPLASVTAYIALTLAQLEAPVTAAPVLLTLPPGVKVADQSQTDIELTITEIESN
ncbi:MAG: hypothetical protein CMJ21_04250 [Phycisphaerae bacterium]|nr:hypothetical protein [Phycisphaerae bacterium]